MKLYPLIFFLAECFGRKSLGRLLAAFEGILWATLMWLGFFSLLAVLTSCCHSADVSFEWNASPSTNVIGYKLYIGTNADFVKSNAVATTISPSTNATWTGAVAGMTYWAFCTASDGTLESVPSNVITFTVPLPPALLRVKLALFQSSGVNGPWEPVNAPCWEFETPMTTNQAFYRGLVQIER